MLRLTPMVVQGATNKLTGDCNTGLDATSGGTLTGGVVDRIQLGRAYSHAQPFLIGDGLSNTSTGGAKSRKVDLFLVHGDSSGGGDLAEIDTGLRVAQQQVYNTGLTTDEKVYTTGTIRVQHSGVAYSLIGAKRFIAPAAIVTGPGVTTSTAGGNLLTVGLGLSMLQADDEPPTRKAIIPGGDEAIFTTATNT